MESSAYGRALVGIIVVGSLSFGIQVVAHSDNGANLAAAIASHVSTPSSAPSVSSPSPSVSSPGSSSSGGSVSSPTGPTSGTGGTVTGIIPGTTLSSSSVANQNDDTQVPPPGNDPQYVAPICTNIPAPANLHVTNVTPSSVSLAWDAVPGAAEYEILRKGFLMYVTKNSATISATDVRQVSGSSDDYTVVALDSLGYGSAPSAPATATLTTIGNVPTAPKSLQVSKTDSSSVTLTWKASTDPDGDLKGYAVYVGRVGKAYKFVTSTSQTSIQITDLNPGTTYTYTVSAYDANKNYSAPSDPVRPKTTGTGSLTCSLVATPASIKPGQSVALSWRNNEYNSATTTIDGVGTVFPPSGGVSAMTNSGPLWTSTTIHALMQTPDGNVNCSVAVTVTP